MTEPKLNRRNRVRKGWTDEQSVVWYRVAFFLFGLLFHRWTGHFKAFNSGNVPPSGGVFLIANHASGLDPFILGFAVPHRMVRGPGKIELFKHPMSSYLMRRLGIFPLRPDTADVAAVRTMVELYRHDRVVIIYPEGTRSETGEMGPFSPDFARLMIRLKAPLVPAGVAGAGGALPVGHLVPRRNAPIIVVFGKPFDLTEFYSKDLSAETVKQAADFMQRKVAELLPQAQAERNKLT